MPMYNQMNNMSLFFLDLSMKLLIKVRTPVEKTERFCNLIDFVCGTNITIELNTPHPTMLELRKQSFT